MAKKLSADLMLFAVTAALLGFGLVMVWSASSALAQEQHGSAYHFFLRQLGWALCGLIAMILAMRVDYRRLRNPAVVYGLFGLTSILLITVLFMPAVNDVHRWFRLGALSFQPVELAKLSLILFLAFHLERKREQVDHFLPTLFPALLLLGWYAFLVFSQPDLGSAFTLGLIACAMMFLAGVRLRYFALLFAAAVPVMAWAVLTANYRVARIQAFLDPWAAERRSGSGYQLIQSLIAVGTGGVTGAGFMEGQQKLFYLPYPYSDFIYAVIGEELGLVGAALVVLAFTLFLWRGLRAAWRAPDAFGLLLAAGVTLAIVLQAFINLSVVLGLLPTKGIPLPFISAGGSSLLFTLVGVGLVLNVSQHAD
ncbi:MAG: putative lipid II flippase FtsW [Vicinamibacteria bacterium]|nr:putative lipid II flippase FtsW [Vicinamibacteria bacterium]